MMRNIMGGDIVTFCNKRKNPRSAFWRLLGEVFSRHIKAESRKSLRPSRFRPKVRPFSREGGGVEVRKLVIMT